MTPNADYGRVIGSGDPDVDRLMTLRNTLAQNADKGGRYWGRGSLVVELHEPVQISDGRWLVAVWIDARRPDTTSSHAAPMYVYDIDRNHDPKRRLFGTL